ncbi:MAG: RICIN domain-containing protein [Nitrososphaerota archaeon]|nr:RICIN domain-containing protein [Nitrososphaerota archaeon]
MQVDNTPNQAWQFIPKDQGYYEIIAKQRGACIDDGNSSKADGGLVHLWTRHDGDNQRWKLIEAAGGYFHIISKIGELSIDGKLETNNGAGIHLWTSHDGDTQLWRLVPAEQIQSYKEDQRRKRELQLPESLQELTKVDLPTQIIEDIDIKAIAKKMGKLFKDLNRVTKLKHDREDDGFLKKFRKALSGETTDSLVDALDVQGELLKIQSALMVLNTMFAKVLKKQQDYIVTQQDDIRSVNQQIISDEARLDAQNEEIKAQQNTILSLINLTSEQEKKIRDVIRQAQYVKELEARLDQSVGALSETIQANTDETKAEFSRQLEAANREQRSALQDAVQNLESIFSKSMLSEANERKNAVDDQLTIINGFKNSMQASLDEILTTSARRYRWTVFFLVAIACVLVLFAFKIF